MYEKRWITWNKCVAFVKKSVSHGPGVLQYLNDILPEHGRLSLQTVMKDCWALLLAEQELMKMLRSLISTQHQHASITT